MKHLSLREIRELGLIVELNRLVLHPLGLALEARVFEEPVNFVELSDAGVAALRAHADTLDPESRESLLGRLNAATRYVPGDGYLSGVQDHRDDPEGMYYGPLPHAVHAAVLRGYELRDEKARARLAALGYLIQPLDEIPVDG